jgi:NAD(P)-dependent dehydrogenase (short-subunit alcohol dehydrogenase family)
MMPMGEPWVEPEDISNVLVFLASDNARYITGTVCPVDQVCHGRGPSRRRGSIAEVTG